MVSPVLHMKRPDQVGRSLSWSPQSCDRYNKTGGLFQDCGLQKTANTHVAFELKKEEKSKVYAKKKTPFF